MRLSPWKLFQFPMVAMEREYRKTMELYAIQFTSLWCVIQFLDGLVTLFWRAFYFNWFHQVTWDFAAHFIPPLIPAALFVVTKWYPSAGRRAGPLLCVACVAMVGWTSWTVHFMTTVQVQSMRATILPNVWPLVQSSSEAMQELETFIAQDATTKYFWFALHSICLMFAILQLLGLNLHTAIVFVSLPISVAITAKLSPVLIMNGPHVISSAIHAVLYMLCASYLIHRLQQKRVQSEYLFQQTLQNEAMAMEKLAKQEATHKEQALQADTILNHMLKNIMADAASCIYLFTKSVPSQVPPDLAQAMSCLDRGMAWCKKRNAMLQISHGEYTPILAPVNLQELGEALVLGRAMSCTFVNEVVALDRVLCDIILENALHNAYVHGDPDSPDVQFSMQLEPKDPNVGLMQLTIRVSNRIHPDRPEVTDDLISSVLSGDHGQNSPRATSLSDHLGLRHLFMAAEAHNMQLSLMQENDTVVMQAVVQVEEYIELEQSSKMVQDSPGTLSLGLSSFPPSLVVMCLEDSAVARRLLHHVLRSELPDANVHSFGENATQVESFMQEALAFADVIILDNHLEYGSAHYLGTDILQSLIAKGYRGFACIRSANASEEDQVLYAQCGAHLSMGKDLRPQDMVNRLKSAYLHFRQYDLERMPSTTLLGA